MTIEGKWIAPRECPALTDLEFSLKNGDCIKVSWESATFRKRNFHASGVSTTDQYGRVTSGNLKFLKENIVSIDYIHYLSTSMPATFVEELVFTDSRFGTINSETWRFTNPKFEHHA